MGPPFVLIEGEGSHQGKVGFTPLYPGVNPTPHWLPVPHWGELKFPRVINPDSPLNDSRQLEWPALQAEGSLSHEENLERRVSKG